MNKQTVLPVIRVVNHSNGTVMDYFDKIEKLDFDINGSRDFELTILKNDYDSNLFEIGNFIKLEIDELSSFQDNAGIITSIKYNNFNNYIVIKGVTVRGLLMNKIICPPYGEDYRIIQSGSSVGTAMHGILNEAQLNVTNQSRCYYTDGVPLVTETPSVQTTKAFQFNRYCTFLEGMEDFLKDNNLKLSTEMVFRPRSEGSTDAYGTRPKLKIEVRGDEINDYTDEYISNNYTGLYYEVESNLNSYIPLNFIIGLGRGELAERDVVRFRRALRNQDVYNPDYGSIVEDPMDSTRSLNCSPIEVSTMVYDNTNAETLATLKTMTAKKFKEEMSNRYQYSLSVNQDLFEYALDIGDIIGCEDDTIKNKIRGRVTNKIIRIEQSKVSVEYTLENVVR